MRVGFIGLGNMGEPMATRLASAAIDLSVVSRRSDVRDRLTAVGAEAVDRADELVECPILFTMLPDLPETMALLDSSGLLDPPDRGLDRLIVVMSSVSPVAMAEAAGEVSMSTNGSVRLVDAPVSGGVGGATSGRLSIMVGASIGDFERLIPLLEVLGSTVRRMGPVGTGSLTKACNQLIVAATAAALGEAVVIAEESNVEVPALLDVLGGGLANSRLLHDKRQKILDADYSPSGAAGYMSKDLASLAAGAHAVGITTPVTSALREFYDRLVDDGFGALDLIATRAEIRHLSGRMDTTPRERD
ncbi:MAG TPA: NAD(P)-dependent oxidoreductase [Lacisediminihabitans sp.]|uniref:NAD(P)-dependent oxidoreductase n=1 Tax=Lacisediminihabitans sp. TaxID=2787631 RepID=UPI002EDB3AE8